MAFDERNDLIAQISTPNRPLVVRASAVMVRAVEPASRIGSPEPFEGLLVADVHAQRDLWLTPIAPEMALADEQPDEESRREVVWWTGLLWARARGRWTRRRRVRCLPGCIRLDLTRIRYRCVSTGLSRFGHLPTV